MNSDRVNSAESNQKSQSASDGPNSASDLERELAQFIIKTLALEDVSANDIGPDMPLFGGGLGLDSVDALELAVSLQKEYGIKLDPKDEASISALSSIRNLAKYVTEHRVSEHQSTGNIS